MTPQERPTRDSRPGFAAYAIGYGVTWLVVSVVWEFVLRRWFSDAPPSSGRTILGIALGTVFFGVAMAWWHRFLERREDRNAAAAQPEKRE